MTLPSLSSSFLHHIARPAASGPGLPPLVRIARHPSTILVFAASCVRGEQFFPPVQDDFYRLSLYSIRLFYDQFSETVPLQRVDSESRTLVFTTKSPCYSHHGEIFITC